MNYQYFRILVPLMALGIISLAGFQCSLPEAPDTTQPVCAIIHPAPDQVISGIIPVVASATDDDAIKQIKLYIDGISVKTQDANSLTYQWDTTPIADNRDHYLMALAIDKSDNIGYSPIVRVRVIKGELPDTLAPVINIVYPVPGQLVSGTVPVLAQVIDDSPLDRVEFYVDGYLAATDNTAPYQFDWDVSNLPDGSTHAVFAKAFDTNLNSSVSNVVTVTVSQNVGGDITPPTVTILYPPAGAILSGSATITVVADVSDETGIDRVEIYIDGILKKTDSQAPYDYQWNLAGYADGQLHTVYVKAYDTAGNSSAAMNVVTINP